MVKKLLIMCICTICSLIALCSEFRLPKDYMNCENVNQINEWITKTNESKHYQEQLKNKIIYRLSVLKQLVGKNCQNLTYEQFKNIITERQTLPFFTLNVIRFNDYNKNVLNDLDFCKQSNVIMRVGNRVYGSSPAEWRMYISKNIQNVTSPTHFKMIIKLYQKRMIKYTDEQIKEDMRLFKRVVFPKIDQSMWKEVAVKIELILKSVN